MRNTSVSHNREFFPGHKMFHDTEGQIAVSKTVYVLPDGKFCSRLT